MRIQNIQFFKNEEECISSYRSLPWKNKALSYIKSYGTLLSYSLSKMTRFGKNFNVHSDGDFSKRKLVVCFHGLNNNSNQFKSTVDEINKGEISEVDIYIPKIEKKGNAELDQMVRPIFDEIHKWLETGGEKELVLVGISNGARIARAVEAELAHADARRNLRNVRFVSIVGACRGSSFVNVINRIPLISKLLSKNISAEMPVGSERNCRLDADWSEGRKNTPEIDREYFFLAVPNDGCVPNFSSTLMVVPNQEKKHYAILPNHGHNSIVDAAAKAVAEIVLHGDSLAEHRM